ncbi:MAG: TIGR01620 family protein [Cohaesibacteraceae bacterium]|nr:TIGR01620 family protein [Cohaesibacteraceae bacterium]
MKNSPPKSQQLPLAIQLTAGGKNPRAQIRVEEDISFEPEFEAQHSQPKMKPARFSWSGFFFSILLTLIVFQLLLSAEAYIQDLFTRQPTLGWIALGLVIGLAFTFLVFVGREIRAISRLKKLDAFRNKTVKIHNSGSKRKPAIKLIGGIVDLYASRREMTLHLRALKSDLANAMDGRDIIAITERTIMHPLDRDAMHAVHASAQRGAVITAISPRAFIDLAAVIYETIRMVRKIAQIYGGRPGMFAFTRLFRAVAAQLVITGGLAATEAVVQQVLGHGIAARLSAKLGQGLLNGIFIARVGIAAIEACRPMPFSELKEPKVREVIKALGRRAKVGEADSQ